MAVLSFKSCAHHSFLIGSLLSSNSIRQESDCHLELGTSSTFVISGLFARCIYSNNDASNE